ncbi:hypothetical protein COU17_01520 [Candidatus Kaiserbacteria bacterium CG10_big_fil_rev_8_21_14_0_10_49_17]|uniref:Uncharacterized protein n=1 Tax=Candidatus Kaiserbacteria bacterium CG10_big_fil_rev_8_21_14_0_10_49_17 TaxID=1974609 RepID=A0A2M6WEX0_9BACT|nr:MAG: hypothetical protein COU17_01520 [Candidatus Kaiserbacteria bacterium CG10_big_fil_rev_8_21_14_0_10_49_17]
MDQETKDLLHKNLEITKENNRLLRRVRSGAAFDRIIKILWIAFLVGIPIYLYFTILQPIIGQVSDAAKSVHEAGAQVKTTGVSIQEQIGNILDLLPFSGGESEQAQ